MARSTTSTLKLITVPTEVVTADAPDTRAARRKAAKIARTATAKRRRARIDWYALGILLLILLSGAVTVYRLLWSMQP